MIKTIQSQPNINQDSDLDNLRLKIKPILGQICWRVKISYGDELRLDIGEKISYHHPKMGNRQKGSWNFGTRGTYWQLENNHNIIVNSNLESSEILQQLKIIEDKIITEFNLNYSDLKLTIKFNNNYQLKIIPDLTNQEYQDVACWELFTPNNQVLTVYPNFYWVASLAE